MDILYISPKAQKELSLYCDEKLVTEVINHFTTKGTIVANYDDTKRCLWIVTDYIQEDTIERKKKLSVILSLAAVCGCGIIQIGNRQALGDVNVLCMLKDLKYISEEDFDYFVEAFFNFSQGKGVKFT